MNQQKGLSLVELMVSITVGIILMTGVVQMFVSSKTVFSTQQGLSRVQETGRLAIDFIARDVRQAGYLGCAYITPWNLKNMLNNQNDFGSNFSAENAIRIHPAGVLPAGLNLDPAPLNDTQVLIVQAANERSVPVAKDNTENAVFVELTTEPGAECPSGICVDDIVVAADCDKAIIFQATDVAEVGGEVVISHEAGADPGNSRIAWGGGDARQETLSVGAELFALNTVVYYVAEDDEGTPGLYQRINANPAFQLLQGVENINFTVGLDTNSDRLSEDLVAFGAVGDDWEDAVALRMEILVQTPDDNATTENQTYSFAGENVTADDKRIRQVFTTTVGIRSRLP